MVFFTHAATFAEVFDNFRAAGGLNAPSPAAPHEVEIRSREIRDFCESASIEGSIESLNIPDEVKRFRIASVLSSQSEGDEA